LVTTTDVENYPGFADGILGPVLMQVFEQQAARFGAEMHHGMVTGVDFSQHPFQIWIDRKTLLLADAVIIATGATHRYLGLENERRLIGRGVSSCATCDGAFFRDEPVAIVGGGDTAMQNALQLARIAKQVYIIHRRDRLRASQILQQRVLERKNVSVCFNSVVLDILGETELEGIRLVHLDTQETSILPIRGLFVSIGHKPNSDLFRGWLELDDKGYIQTRPDSTHTSIAGVFACGDVQDRVYRQAVTAAGTGCMAAMDAEHWLMHEPYQVSVATEIELVYSRTVRYPV
jgi:thioredoxin reductase (NADPH)